MKVSFRFVDRGCFGRYEVISVGSLTECCAYVGAEAENSAEGEEQTKKRKIEVVVVVINQHTSALFAWTRIGA